jgi:hypothetical protein
MHHFDVLIMQRGVLAARFKACYILVHPPREVYQDAYVRSLDVP